MAIYDRLLEIVDLAYAAAIEPQLWPDVMQGAAEVTDSRRAVLLHRLGGRLDAIGSTRLDPAAPRAYLRDYQTINPIQRQIDRIGALGVVTDRAYVDKADLLVSDFYDRFMRPNDMHTFIFVPFKGSPGTTLNIIRGGKEREFEPHEVEVARSLERPLTSAFTMGLRLASAWQAAAPLAEFIEGLAGAVLVVRNDGHVVYANRAGERLLAENDGLAAPKRTLRAATPQASANLARLIGQATSPSAHNGGEGVIALPRPSGGSPLTALVIPARGETAFIVPGGPLAIVSVSAPEGAGHESGDQLREMFGLTIAEVEVLADLVAGREARAIAERRRVSVNTVRAQIASILSKTDTRRQGELIALMLRSLGSAAWVRRR